MVETVRSEESIQVRKHVSKGCTLALKPMTDVVRSPKQGYKCLRNRTDVLQKYFKKNKKLKDFSLQVVIGHTCVASLGPVDGARP